MRPLAPTLLIPSTQALLFALLFWLSLFFMPPMLNGDGDLGRHLTIGRVILETGQIPQADIFSHTMAGTPLVPHEWLSQLLFALAYRVAGLDGVAWLTAAVIAATYTVLSWGLRRLAVRAPLALGAGVVAALVGWLHMLTRPHIFTTLFFAAFLVLLELYRTRGERRWLLPMIPAMVLWANLHGAFITGFVLVGLYAVGLLLDRQPRRAATLLALGGALLLAAWLNPVGPGLVTHSFGYLGNRFLVNRTYEYQSPDFHIVSTWPFAALLLLALVAGWRRPAMAWPALLVLGLWAAFGLYSARNIPLFGLVGALLLAREGDAWLAARWPRLSEGLAGVEAMDRQAWGWGWALLVLLLLLGRTASGQPVDGWGEGNRFDPAAFPVAAVETLQREGLPEGPMFNEFAWGGFLLHQLWPEARVFIDAQTDFYGEAMTREYLEVEGVAPTWQAVLDRYQVQWILIPAWRPLNEALARSPDWQARYRDEVTVVWVRR